MNIVTLLSTDRVTCIDELSSKKRAFEKLAVLLSQEDSELGFDHESVFNALIAREKLGSTALGNGIVLPHASLNVPEAKAALLLLEEGIEMDTPDKKPVHLLLALIVPNGQAEDYQPLLSDLAIVLNRKTLAKTLLELGDPALILDYLSSLFVQKIAA
ncbi:MAG: PTS sugar transporter subunit IIA [Thiothrix sp.]|nr:MAG: PTS sugar transporter subunit IIA [Thiothrix sp.]